MPGIDMKSKTAKYIHVRQREPFTFIQDSLVTIAFGKKEDGIKAVMGKLKKEPNGGMKVQAMLFDKEKFTVKEAEKWIKTHGYKVMNKAFAGCFEQPKEDISIETLLSEYTERRDSYIKTLKEAQKIVATK